MCGRQVSQALAGHAGGGLRRRFAQSRRGRQPSGITSRANIPGSIRQPSCLSRCPLRSCRMCMAAAAWTGAHVSRLYAGGRAGHHSPIAPVLLLACALSRSSWRTRSWGRMDSSRAALLGGALLFFLERAAPRWLSDRASRIQAASRDPVSDCPHCRRVLARHRGGGGDSWAYCAVIVGNFRPRCLDRILPEFADGIAVDA